MRPEAPAEAVPSLRWLAIAALLHPIGRGLVETLFTLIHRPVPTLVGVGVAGLYIAIPAAALWVARDRALPGRARWLLAAGAVLSVVGLFAELLPLRLGSFIGIVFSILNDLALNVGVALLALGVGSVNPARSRGILLEASLTLSIGIVIEIIWSRLRGAMFVDGPPSTLVFVMSQVLFLVPLLLLAGGAFGIASEPRKDAEDRSRIAFALATVAATLPIVLSAPVKWSGALEAGFLGLPAIARLLLVFEGMLAAILVGEVQRERRVGLVIGSSAHVAFVVFLCLSSVLEIDAMPRFAPWIWVMLAAGALLVQRTIVRGAVAASLAALALHLLAERSEGATATKASSLVAAAVAAFAISIAIRTARRTPKAAAKESQNT